MADPTPEQPYKFLDYYKLQDEPIFFGRKRETRILAADIVINRLVVLFAKTGTGKTSLINAGVRPNLNDRGYETFFVRVNKDPEASARGVLTSEKPMLRQIEILPLAEFLQQAARLLKKPIVLFFDQFEEFFVYVYVKNRAKAQQFISAVAELYKNEKSGVHIVLSLREDFLADMDAFRDKLPAILHNDSNLRLLWFDEQQAREAIQGPANKFAVKIEKALEDQLIQDLAKDMTFDELLPGEGGDGGGGGDWSTNHSHSNQELRIEPARLQIVCDTLWKEKPASRKSITLADYRELGKSSYLKPGTGENIARQILYRRLVEVFEQITDKRQLDILEKLLPKLRIEETKHVYEVSSLAKDIREDLFSVQALLRLLAVSGLVRLQKIRGDIEVVELAHDYLVSHLADLQQEVRKIWPRRILAAALGDYQKQKKLVSADDLKEISEKVSLVDFSGAQAEIFFRSALKIGKYIDLWFEKASEKGVKVWEILEQGIRGQEPQQHIHIRKLLVQLQTPEVFDFLNKMVAIENFSPRVEWALERLAESDTLETASRAKEIIEELATIRSPTATTVEVTSRGPSVRPPFGLISELLRSGEIVPILGAGVNFGTRPPGYRWDTLSAPFPPSNSELSRYLAEIVSFPTKDEATRSDLARVASYFAEVSGRGRLRDRLHEFLDHDFEICSIHAYLASLPNPLLIITTLYDDMLERAFREAGHPYDLVVFPTDRPDVSGSLLWWRHEAREPEPVRPNSLHIDLTETTVIYKIFGSIDRASNEWDSYVITEDDYLELLYRVTVQAAVPAQFIDPLRNRGLLFLGYGLHEWTQRMLLKLLMSFVRGTVDEVGEGLNSLAIQDRPSSLDNLMWNLHNIKSFDMDINEFTRKLRELK